MAVIIFELKAERWSLEEHGAVAATDIFGTRHVVC